MCLLSHAAVAPWPRSVTGQQTIVFGVCAYVGGVVAVRVVGLALLDIFSDCFGLAPKKKFFVD